jgi:hypothetical protein
MPYRYFCLSLTGPDAERDLEAMSRTFVAVASLNPDATLTSADDPLNLALALDDESGMLRITDIEAALDGASSLPARPVKTYTPESELTEVMRGLPERCRLHPSRSPGTPAALPRNTAHGQAVV